MLDDLARLRAVMGPALGPTLRGDEGALGLVVAHGVRGRELADFLLARNGCYSGARSLLIRPLEGHGAPLGLVTWNDPGGWRSAYRRDVGQALFFAEDLFGEQFALREDAIWRFDPETADWRPSAPTLDAWARALLEEEGRPDLDSPAATRWQERHGPIRDGYRLRPPVPFLFAESAEATLDEYRTVDETDVMTSLADIANAVGDVPEGQGVVLRTRRAPADEGRGGRAGRRWRWPWRRGR